MLSTRPYFLRAIWEWAEDSGLTPQLLVDANAEGVVVPEEHVADGQIVLNISSSAVRLEAMDNEKVAFSARFDGKPRDIYLPMDSILAIYARENRHGIFFQESGGEEHDEAGAEARDEADQDLKRDRSHLKIIK
jgi:stringent starvation protein B